MGVRFTAVPFADLKRRPPRPWMVDGLIPAGVLAVLFSESGKGKTFAALDLACGIPRGRAWGREVPTPGPTLYVAGEGAGGLAARVAAWEAVNGETVKPDAVLIPEAPDVGDADHREEIVRAYREAVPNADPILVVVDTLDRCFGDGDENRAQDMRRFVRGCDALREALGGPTMLVLHHTGHAQKSGERRERGSSGLRAAVDRSIRLDGPRGPNLAPGDGLALTFVKVKDGRTPESVALTIAEADVPGGTSLAVIPADGPAARFARLSAQRRAATTILATTFGTDPFRKDAATIAAGVSGKQFDDLRDECVPAGFMRKAGKDGNAKLYALTGDALAAIGEGEDRPRETGSPLSPDSGSPVLPSTGESGGRESTPSP